MSGIPPNLAHNRPAVACEKCGNESFDIAKDGYAVCQLCRTVVAERQMLMLWRQALIDSLEAAGVPARDIDNAN